jgi:hypothetical protein
MVGRANDATREEIAPDSGIHRAPGSRILTVKIDVAHFMLNQLMSDAYLGAAPGSRRNKPDSCLIPAVTDRLQRRFELGIA